MPPGEARTLITRLLGFLREHWGWMAALLLLSTLAVAWILPNLLAAKIAWNDRAAIATLRNLASVQDSFRDRKRVDVDGDGIGEFGTFAEMTGVAGVRLDGSGAKRGEPVAPAILSAALADVREGGLVCKSGYLFRILLPGRGGLPVREGLPGRSASGEVDTDAAERHWCACAWPVRDYGEMKGESRFHDGVFFVDESGDLWQTLNQDRRYWGTEHAPSWDAAMPEDGVGVAWAAPPEGVAEYRGRDGNVWKRVD